MRLNGDFHLPRMKWNAARSYGCLTGIRLFQRLGVGRERIRLQSAMRPEVELQLGGRTGSVERKSGSERAGLASPLCSYGRSITLFTFFYPRLGCARRVPPLATPPRPPLQRGRTTCPSDSERACARFLGRRRPCAKTRTLRTSPAALFRLLVAEF